MSILLLHYYIFSGIKSQEFSRAKRRMRQEFLKDRKYRPLVGAVRDPPVLYPHVSFCHHLFFGCENVPAVFLAARPSAGIIVKKRPFCWKKFGFRGIMLAFCKKIPFFRTFFLMLVFSSRIIKKTGAKGVKSVSEFS